MGYAYPSLVAGLLPGSREKSSGPRWKSVPPRPVVLGHPTRTLLPSPLCIPVTNTRMSLDTAVISAESPQERRPPLHPGCSEETGDALALKSGARCFFQPGLFPLRSSKAVQHGAAGRAWLSANAARGWEPRPWVGAPRGGWDPRLVPLRELTPHPTLPPAAPAAAPDVWRRLGPAFSNGSREVTVLIKVKSFFGRLL